MKVKLKLVAFSTAFLMMLSANSDAFAKNELRIAGENRFGTSVKISRNAFSKADSVIIANGMNYPDALSGGQLSTTKKAPILLVDKNSVSNGVLDEIKRLGAENIFVLGGENSVSSSVADTLSSYGKVTRLGGSDRYETSKLIMEEARKDNGYKNVVLVSGKSYADALSATAYAMKNKSVLLLSDGSYYPETDGVVTVIGGKNSLNFDGRNVNRISGSDRYSTSLSVAKTFDSDNLVVASGESFPDALAAAGLNVSKDAPTLLVPKSGLSKDEKEYLKKDFSNVYIVGGENTISKNTEKFIKNGKEVVEKKIDVRKNPSVLNFVGNKIRKNIIYPGDGQIMGIYRFTNGMGDIVFNQYNGVGEFSAWDGGQRYDSPAVFYFKPGGWETVMGDNARNPIILDESQNGTYINVSKVRVINKPDGGYFEGLSMTVHAGGSGGWGHLYGVSVDKNGKIVSEPYMTNNLNVESYETLKDGRVVAIKGYFAPHHRYRMYEIGLKPGLNGRYDMYIKKDLGDKQW